MSNFVRFVATPVLAILMAVPACSSPVLTLLQSGAITGEPGERIGWGFSITNDAHYIEITSAQFCLDPVSFPACTLPIQGTFTDFISQFSDIVVGPLAGTLPDTVSQIFDAILFTGVGSFDIAPGAPVFSADFGQIVLTYNVFDGDPNGVDPVNQLFFDQILVANAMVFVDTPEPGSFALVFAGALAVLAARKRR